MDHDCVISVAEERLASVPQRGQQQQMMMMPQQGQMMYAPHQGQVMYAPQQGQVMYAPQQGQVMYAPAQQGVYVQQPGVAGHAVAPAPAMAYAQPVQGGSQKY